MSHLDKQMCVNDLDEDSHMKMDDPPRLEEQVEEDPFLAFVEYARSVVFSEDEVEGGGGYHDPEANRAEGRGPGWSWIVSRILKSCITYSSGVTSAILLSDLAQAWSEQHRTSAPKRRPECINQLRRKHGRMKLPKTVTIDSIYEKNFLSLSNALEAVIVDVYLLPGTNIYMLSLGDFWSTNTIDLYLHRRYYDLVDPQNGVLRKGREVLLTGCYLRNAHKGSGCTRLLPTEYLVILLDDDQDDDAILIGAQFCSDSFSSITLDGFEKGASYSLYARIESIGSPEILGTCGLQRQEIILVDNDGVKLKFLLWGEQIFLSNLFSVGSMLALDRPYISTSVESAIEACDELCLEYGSATLLYLVPFIQNEEKICVPLTQNRCQGSRMLSTSSITQDPRISQVALPRDSQGTVDFSNYPFRPYIIDLHDKMTGISLYGVVTDIFREKTTEAIFLLQIKDTTGAIWAKLHFSKSWSLGRICLGHTVFISGLSCYLMKQNCLELSWFANDVGASLTNLSSLPALLNSSCLHKLSCLSDLTSHRSSMLICQVRVDQIDHCCVRLSHALCGNFVIETCGIIECGSCRCSCEAEVVRSFHLKITLADESAKIFAWCSGQTAAELLQISPDEFYELPQEEQIMYPSSLENERFVVMLVDCKNQGRTSADGADVGVHVWEISCALKSE